MGVSGPETPLPGCQVVICDSSTDFFPGRRGTAVEDVQCLSGGQDQGENPCPPTHSIADPEDQSAALGVPAQAATSAWPSRLVLLRHSPPPATPWGPPALSPCIILCWPPCLASQTPAQQCQPVAHEHRASSCASPARSQLLPFLSFSCGWVGPSSLPFCFNHANYFSSYWITHICGLKPRLSLDVVNGNRILS